MQSPIDPIRLLGRHSRISTRTGRLEGTIVAAGVRGLDVAGTSGVQRVSPADMVSIEVD